MDIPIYVNRRLMRGLKMTQNLKKNEHVLRLILENNYKLNKCIFSYIKDKSIKAIVEIIYNVWNLPLNKNQKKVCR